MRCRLFRGRQRRTRDDQPSRRGAPADYPGAQVRRSRCPSAPEGAPRSCRNRCGSDRCYTLPRTPPGFPVEPLSRAVPRRLATFPPAMPVPDLFGRASPPLLGAALIAGALLSCRVDERSGREPGATEQPSAQRTIASPPTTPPSSSASIAVAPWLPPPPDADQCSCVRQDPLCSCIEHSRMDGDPGMIFYPPDARSPGRR